MFCSVFLKFQIQDRGFLVSIWFVQCSGVIRRDDRVLRLSLVISDHDFVGRSFLGFDEVWYIQEVEETRWSCEVRRVFINSIHQEMKTKFSMEVIYDVNITLWR